MKVLLLFLLLLMFARCEQEPPYPDHGCVVGIHKNRMVKEVIGCWHEDVYKASANQAAADSAADNAGVPRINVSMKEDYLDIQFSQDEDCDCQVYR
jgi:hypothetical protein